MIVVGAHFATPSRLMNSLITIRMQVGRCHTAELIALSPSLASACSVPAGET